MASTGVALPPAADRVSDRPSRQLNLRPILLIGFGVVLLILIAIGSEAPVGGWLRDLAARPWTSSDVLLIVGFALAATAIAAGTIFPTTYMPALWAIAPLVPGLSAITMVAAYLVVPDSAGGVTTKFFIGLEIGVGIAVVSAVPLRILATVRVAQTRSYWELRRRSEQLAERLRVVAKSGPPRSTDGQRGQWTPLQLMALAEAEEQLKAVHEALFMSSRESRTNGLEWVSAMGYVSLWRRVNRAEESLIEIEPIEGAMADALHDQLRLAGSAIKNDGLMVALAAAVKVIGPSWYEKYFARAAAAHIADSAAVTGAAAAAATAAAAGSAATNGSTAAATETPGPGDIAAARAVLREVRHAVNTYVEDKMESIVRARNRLWRAILVTATTTFLLVGLAVLSSVLKAQLVAASTFFLVAAIVGLFNRLRLQAKADSAVEDFNLFEARLIHTPLISGLAGVAGVFLVAVVPAATSQSITTVSLGGIFDLSQNLIGILVAAAFGLAPDRIIGPLQDQTERLKTQLKAGQAAIDSTPASSSNGAQGDSPDSA